jgi:hydroxyethylthiazole kinase-like uncharacterized protein yjeF
VTGDPAPPARVQALDDELVAGLLPVRAPRSHKGSHGRLLVVAGSLEYAGAALLVARSAGRAGAGLVRLAVAASLQPLFAGRVAEAVTLGLPETAVAGEIDADLALPLLAASAHEALVLGPGLRSGEATARLTRSLLGAEQGPALVDAEALNALSGAAGWATQVRAPCVLTPHVGEFLRLLPEAASRDLVGDDEARAATAADASRAWGQVVVLKGARTVIASPDGEIAQAPFENPALASAGTGDVLAGAVGSLLAQGLTPYAAACVGVYLHGLAGEAVRERFGDSGLLASDLPDEIARARHRLERLRERKAGGWRLGFAIDRHERGRA